MAQVTGALLNATRLRISCFVATMKLPHALQIYSNVFVAVDFVADTFNFVADTVDFVASVYRT